LAAALLSTPADTAPGKAERTARPWRTPEAAATLGRERNGCHHRHGLRRNPVRHQPDDIIKGEGGGDRLFGGDGRDTLLARGFGTDTNR
jgi:hypothetical protein